MVLAGVGLDFFTPLLADARTIFQRSRHRGYRDIERLGNVLHRLGGIVVFRHDKHIFGDKITIKLIIIDLR